MRARTLLVSAIATGLLCLGFGQAFGLVAGLAVASIGFWTLCGASLYLSTHRVPEEAKDPEMSPVYTGVANPAGKDDATGGDAAEPSADAHEQDPCEVQASDTQEAQPGEGEPDTLAAPEDPTASGNKPSFDFDAFRRSLLFSDDPLGELRTLVGRVLNREREGKPVTGAESFLARELEDAGLLEEKRDALAHASVVVPRHSGLFYLRASKDRMAYGSYLCLLRIEATLNALLFAHQYYDDLSTASRQDVYRLWQRTTASLCAQAPDVDLADWSYLAMPWQSTQGPADQGEWAVRLALSEAIESVQVPYRLEAQFRCNVAAGDVAIEFGATPARAFSGSAYVQGLGIVDATSHMRSREASSYAARVGILLAAYAFGSSGKIRRVWVSAIEGTPTERRCLYSVCMGRRAFSHVRMAGVSDPLATLRSLGASFNEALGTFLPTRPLFYLEDELFCPPKRHDLWSLSERSLPVSAVRALGASRVSGLVIHEELPRTVAADEILRGLASADSKDATLRSVDTILGAARRTSDLSVWTAAERLSQDLVFGRIGPDDLDSLHDEFVAGDSLTKAVEHAQRLLAQQDAMEALSLLREALAPIDAAGLYSDTPTVAYRSFNSFCERVIYNRLNAQDKRSLVLAPDAYLIAHLSVSAILLALPKEMGGSVEQALKHARRAAQIAPMSLAANLGLAACLEQSGDAEGAIMCLSSFLEVSWNPQETGIAYLRLASLLGRQGDQPAAQACYQQAVRLHAPLFPFAMAEFQNMLAQSDDQAQDSNIELMDDKQIEKVLEQRSVPLAPTPQTSFILYDGATASIDAEVFPVARELMRTLEYLTGDDVIRGIRKSLENEPDV